ncbi:MAG TPA: site-specific integrase [Gemmataceae bacterium]|nr:site-specific integrase [Gemmataceae bacterium]
MPKRSHPWFRSCKNAWYVKIQGKAVSLGVKGEESEAEAVKAWHRLCAGMPLESLTIASELPIAPPADPLAKAEAVSVQSVIMAFLADTEERVSPECQRNYRKHLLPFAKRYGSRSAESLTIAEAEAYARKPEWSLSYRNGMIGSLVSAYLWAKRERLIAHDPLIGIRKPPKASRGTKALISADAHARLVACAEPLFRAFLELLWHTGARPGEIAGLRAEDIDLEHGLVVLEEHKEAHLGKSRVIFLSPEALAVVKGIGRESGLLFPGEDGQRMTAQAIGCRLRRLCVKAGVKHCIAYGYRHTFATDALANGVPDAQVAALLGHSGTAMLHKHYLHLGARVQVLREALGRVR